MRRTAFSLFALTILTALTGPGLSPAEAATVNVSANITASETWTADNVYVLTQVIYCTDGATLTIEAGTVIRGEPESSPGANDPGTLVIARGCKIRALGTAERPIVFTDMQDDNIGANPGTFPYDSLENALSLTAQWGGVILLGRAYVSNDTLNGPDPTREVQIEGLTAAGGLGFYGGGGDDDDDSGTMSYVSVRYGGFNLSPDNEINGISLGGIGRETDFDHIEVFQNKDDGVEVFGGTVNIRHLAVISPADDGLDYDEGWRGKAQFVFVMQGTPASEKSDKGGEHDGGNNPDGSQPFGIPTIYNATYIGLGQKAFTDSTKDTAIHFRDNAGGRYYNSFFGDFGGAPFMIEGGALPSGGPNDPLTSGERAITPYVADGVFEQGPNSGLQLELRNDTFWCFGSGGAIPSGDATAWGGDSGKNFYDNGPFINVDLENEYLDCASPLPIRTLVRTSAGLPDVPDPITSVDPRPVPGGPLTQTDRSAPADGIYDQAPYRGAFAPDENWLAGWSTVSRLGYLTTCDPGVSPDAVPDDVRDLRFASDKETLYWTAPALGFNVRSYDLLRSTNASDFSATTATCVESADFGTRAVDPSLPSDGQVSFYLVRARNDCGGMLGFDSVGVERTGTTCP